MLSKAKVLTGHAVLHGERCRVVAEVGMSYFKGNRSPHFSMTATIYDSKGDDFMGGCCHDEIALAFPEYAGLIKYHLFAGGEPIHYIPNAVYWADCYKGRYGDKPSQAHIENFCSHVCYGVVDDDEDNSPLAVMRLGTPALECWLRTRATKLTEAFCRDMNEAGIQMITREDIEEYMS